MYSKKLSRLPICQSTPLPNHKCKMSNTSNLHYSDYNASKTAPKASNAFNDFNEFPLTKNAQPTYTNELKQDITNMKHNLNGIIDQPTSQPQYAPHANAYSNGRPYDPNAFRTGSANARTDDLSNRFTSEVSKVQDNLRNFNTNLTQRLGLDRFGETSNIEKAFFAAVVVLLIIIILLMVFKK